MADSRSGWTSTCKVVRFIFLLCISDLTSAQIRYSIPEEQERGAAVGNIAADLGLNSPELPARKCRLVSQDGKQYFGINMENGILFVSERIDREQLCGESSTCALSFEVRIENPAETHRVEIEISDINDNPPAFPKSVLDLEIAESNAPGTRFPLESAHDPDVGTNAVNDYQLSSNEHFGLKVQTRSSGNKIIELLLEKPLDREHQSTFHLMLTAFDGGSPKRSGTVEITITIGDANDNAPVFEHEIYRTDLLENAPKGTLVIKVNAGDSDQGTNAELTYSFSKHASRQVRQLFSVDPDTGEIRVQGALDFEKSNVYELDVQAVDHGAPRMAGHSSVLVRLTDVNDNSPEIQLTSVSNTVGEEAAPGTVIAAISVTDLDSGKNGEIHCQISRNVPFQLQISPDNHYKLVTSERLDREKVDRYNINIFAWDSGSPPLSTNKTINVLVSDTNDNAPRFEQPSYTAYVMENNAPGDSILSLTALDPDSDQNSYVSYSNLENHIQDFMSFPYISVDSKSGNVYALRSFDYEQLKNFQFQVQARDSGSPPLSSSAAVNVIILDQNDNAPVVVSPATRNGSATVDPVPQSAPAGYLVTKVMATDADSGQNARLSYQLVKTSDSGLFAVGLHSGEIRLVRSIVDNDAPNQSCVIIIKDNGQPRFSATVTIGFSIVANVTRNDLKRSSVLNKTERFSDLNLYLIILFGTTSFLFLLIIMMLVALKCHQDSSIGRGYDSGICCYSRNESRDQFTRRSTARESAHYPGMRESGAIPDMYNYRFSLSPESAKSDFLFLKSYNSTLPQSALKITDTNVVKEFDQQFNSAVKGQ